MPNYYCKLISTEYSPAVEKEIRDFIQSTLGNVSYQPFLPYWKNPGQGELSFSFSSDKDLSEIKSLFADCWQTDTADIRQSTVYCPMSTFIWLSQ